MIKSVLLKTILALLLTGLIAAAAVAKDRKYRGTYSKPTITAEQAFSTVKNALPKLAVGKSFVRTGRRGEKKLGVTLVLEGEIVSVIRLNPATGEILPKGQEILVYEVAASQEQAVKIVQQAIPNLEAASVRLGGQGDWKVDLTLKKMVVASLHVQGGDGSILLLGSDRKETADGRGEKLPANP
jgi:hypothetical protein